MHVKPFPHMSTYNCIVILMFGKRNGFLSLHVSACIYILRYCTQIQVLSMVFHISIYILCTPTQIMYMCTKNSKALFIYTIWVLSCVSQGSVLRLHGQLCLNLFGPVYRSISMLYLHLIFLSQSGSPDCCWYWTVSKYPMT